jgi:PilZ domain
MEHRWGGRKLIDVPVRFMALPATIGTGRIINVSMTGAFLETRAELRPMAMLRLEMIDPGRCGRLTASVVRHSELGVGLEWCEAAARSPLYARLRSSSQPQVATDLCEYRFDFLD